MKEVQDWTAVLGIRIFVDEQERYWAEIQSTDERIALLRENMRLLEIYVIAYTGRMLSELTTQQTIYWGFVRSFVAD